MLKIGSFNIIKFTTVLKLFFDSQKNDYADMSPPVFYGVCVAQSLVFCGVFCRLSFGHCVVVESFFFDLRLLITLLVSSNSSYSTCKQLN